MEIFAVRKENLQRLRDDPPLVWQLIAPDEPEMYEEARAEYARGRAGLLGRILGRTSPPAAVAPLTLSPGEGPAVDLDKAWHGLHYLFTGSAEGGDAPMDFLAVGGDEIGTVDVGYGPARSLPPETVREIARRLAGLSDEELRARFDPTDMLAKDIYPGIWSRDGQDDDPLAYLVDNLAGLRTGVAHAAEGGFGLVLVLH